VHELQNLFSFFMIILFYFFKTIYFSDDQLSNDFPHMIDCRSNLSIIALVDSDTECCFPFWNEFSLKKTYGKGGLLLVKIVTELFYMRLRGDLNSILGGFKVKLLRLS